MMLVVVELFQKTVTTIASPSCGLLLLANAEPNIDPLWPSEPVGVLSSVMPPLAATSERRDPGARGAGPVDSVHAAATSAAASNFRKRATLVRLGIMPEVSSSLCG